MPEQKRHERGERPHAVAVGKELTVACGKVGAVPILQETVVRDVKLEHFRVTASDRRAYSLPFNAVDSQSLGLLRSGTEVVTTVATICCAKAQDGSGQLLADDATLEGAWFLQAPPAFYQDVGAGLKRALSIDLAEGSRLNNTRTLVVTVHILAPRGPIGRDEEICARISGGS